MGLREWAWGGVYLSPFFIYTILALLITFFLRLLLQLTPLKGWIWHEALFDSALFVLVLSGIAWLMS